MARKKIESPISSIESTDVKIETPVLVNIEKGKVNCDMLNVRENNSTDSRVISVINRDTEVEIENREENSKWLSVKVGNIKGFVMSDFITIK